ncbi:hypothetical protein HNR46_003598 [Haloferula luteola]|uniref:Uncharacterized protein n=1 Tax=Haloferula luteola TaxID=595692 RepID=A0A840V5U9_9BACT|nr:hypothetical protein [Haloferula luteola]
MELVITGSTLLYLAIASIHGVDRSHALPVNRPFSLTNLPDAS